MRRLPYKVEFIVATRAVDYHEYSSILLPLAVIPRLDRGIQNPIHDAVYLDAPVKPEHDLFCS